jgi:hypothetical protein
MAGTFPLSKGVMRMRSSCCVTPDRGGTPLTVHPLKPLLIVPVLMPATMSSNLFNAPIHDVIDCQDGDHTGVLRSDPASLGDLPENNHTLIIISGIGGRKR